MADLDNPIALIAGFFALVLTIIFALVRILQGFFAGGVIGGGVITLVLGMAWFETFFKK